LEHRATNSTFPHQAIADQFDGEDQFESYRRLGREVALEALERADGDPGRSDSLSRLQPSPTNVP
jgi:hypothetical protein